VHVFELGIEVGKVVHSPPDVAAVVEVAAGWPLGSVIASAVAAAAVAAEVVAGWTLEPVADAEVATVTVPAIATVQVESVFGPLSARVLAVVVAEQAVEEAVEIVVDGARLADEPVDVDVVAAEAGAAEAAAAAPDAEAAVAWHQMDAVGKEGMKLEIPVGGVAGAAAVRESDLGSALDSIVRIADSDRMASDVEQVLELDYTEYLDTGELEEVVDHTYWPNLILGKEKHRNRWRIPTSQDLILLILIVIPESGLGSHHVNMESCVGDCLMIERSMAGKGWFVEVELKMLWAAEGVQSM
jgi:hypothetical protein